jgi:heat shock protein HslJ
MKIFLINLFYLIVLLQIFFAGCSSKDSSNSSEDELDSAVVTADSNTTAIELILKEVTAVETPTTDTTPNYTFSSTKAGTITYGGSCSSSTTVAVTGNNTITLNALSDGTYSDCTITVTDNAGN